MKVKILSGRSLELLEQKVNGFLSSCQTRVIDIKFKISYDNNRRGREFVMVIIYGG